MAIAHGPKYKDLLGGARDRLFGTYVLGRFGPARPLAFSSISIFRYHSGFNFGNSVEGWYLRVVVNVWSREDTLGANACGSRRPERCACDLFSAHERQQHMGPQYISRSAGPRFGGMATVRVVSGAELLTTRRRGLLILLNSAAVSFPFQPATRVGCSE